MLDPKVVSEAMDYIISQLEDARLLIYDLGDTTDEPDETPRSVKAAGDLGRAVGAARAVRMQCDAESRPKTREVSG